MASSTQDSNRANKLSTVFHGVLKGTRKASTSREAKLLLESIRNEPHPSSCVERLLASKCSLDALHQALRVDLSATFLTENTIPLLEYLASDPAVKAMADGQLLQQVVLVVAQPPTVWNALVKLFHEGRIPETKVFAFAWLVLEVISLPAGAGVDVVDDVKRLVEGKRLEGASDHRAREMGYKVKKVFQLRCSSLNGGGDLTKAADGPGGRHDNDFADFRRIAIYPTKDELLSTQPPFCRRAVEVFDFQDQAEATTTSREEDEDDDQNDVGIDVVDKTATRAAIHLDNQYRLLREDMLAELREDLQAALAPKKKPNKPTNPNQRAVRSSLVLSKLTPCDIEFGDPNTRTRRCSLALRVLDGLQFLQRMRGGPGPSTERKKWLKDNASFLRHQDFGALVSGGELVAFAFVERDVDLLAQEPPVVLLRFVDARALEMALLALKVGEENVRFLLVETPVFAYEPVLRGLKELVDVPLQEMLMDPRGIGKARLDAPAGLQVLVEKLKRLREGEAGTLEASGMAPVSWDKSQVASLVSAFTRPVCVIRGPPGTGKSFIGAHAAYALYKLTKWRILVLTYTNHALDQFLEDLVKVKVSPKDMVRLGSKAKSTSVTAPMLLSEQVGLFRRSPDSWNIINSLKHGVRETGEDVKTAFEAYRAQTVTWANLSEFLEFSETDGRFYTALLVPEDEEDDGWALVGNRSGRKVGPDYLYQRWRRGLDPGIFEGDVAQLDDEARSVWRLPPPARHGHLQRWEQAMVEERVAALSWRTHLLDATVERIETLFGEGQVDTLSRRRIVGCTTTGAAKYARLVRAARPDVILIEEAGEVLESHVLAALSPSVKQLVLIGDEKQLRPKVNNYKLSVEKGDGFDLNRSLFERLILQGAPHTTLRKQHRMAPEIAEFPRRLTYPDLLDGDKTEGRPEVKGVRGRVVFVNHGHLEDDDRALRDRRDVDGGGGAVKASKRNGFEAEMVLRCVRYLGQQGYGASQMVVLTPYLGQLRVIRDRLKEMTELDARLSDLDNFELIKAGLMTQSAADAKRSALRISTIDNYQGEESDIVIVSLTRSNENGDIGFMSAPERLNVLATRARNCIIYFGNMATFKNSKKGRNAWQPFFDILVERGYLHDGLPVKCEQHPDTTALLQEPGDFDKCCPDGGCSKPCGAMLVCTLHKCPSRCHRIPDHSQVLCTTRMDKTCDRGHRTSVPCSKRAQGCTKCAEEDRELERRTQRNLKLEADRLQREVKYKAELQEIQDKIDEKRRRLQYKAEAQEQERALKQARADLEAAEEAVEREKMAEEARAMGKGTGKVKEGEKGGSGGLKGGGDDDKVVAGSAKEDWLHQKKFEGASSKALDELMDMIGLEDVKQEFLSIKSKVDTALRQGVSLAKERFGCSLLGNPGTGKTTVARLYAKFLSSVGIIPGTSFKEKTGSALATAGVKGCQDLLDELLTAGGGILFIDEAYQLTSGNHAGGAAVLDFLLAEVENLTGKVVFVLAGYHKQMEAFFAHNPGLPSRFPIEMNFKDYTDEELRRILALKIEGRYEGRMACEEGLDGLYCRIIARRIGRGRGRDGFGNARTVENNLAIIAKRQANRLRKERRAGTKPPPDDMLLTKEDLIGPEPAAALARCEGWKKLQTLIGLGTVKEAVKALVDSIHENYERELAEEPLVEYSLNKVFLGNPGTGKTTVAKLYGQILVSLGLLSKGEVIVKNPSDFVGSVLGQSEQLTKGILAATAGKVLVIDEAYGLYSGSSGQDIYKTAVIDTLVAEVQSVPGDDRCVLLLGYKDQMENMFQNVNPGLSRRFPLASGFVFEDFDDDELRQILELKLGQQGFRATDQAKKVAMEMLGRARNRPNFGNAGEIDILLNDAKSRQQRRRSRQASSNAKGKTKGKAESASKDEKTTTTTTTDNNVLEAVDFDENFARSQRTETNVQMLFSGTVGCADTIRLLEGYQSTVRSMAALDLDPKEHIPFNFLFRGPPGTGKTTTARKMGKVFYDMGFLATAEVVECSASDLIAQYVGQTGPKVRQQLDRALGRVLFVDEAYRLADGHFAKEAMDELTDATTKERYHKKMVIILAGYEDDINRLMGANPGLTSRFPEVLNFVPLTPAQCVDLLVKQLRGQKDVVEGRGKGKGKKTGDQTKDTKEKPKKELDITALETPSAPFRDAMLKLFAALTAQKNWASARDVITLEKAIFKKTLLAEEGLANDVLIITEEMVLQELRSMLKERESRSKATTMPLLLKDLNKRGPLPSVLSPPGDGAAKVATATATKAATGTATKTATKSKTETTAETETDQAEDVQSAHSEVASDSDTEIDFHPLPYPGIRDAGVSDAVWDQLQRDWAAEQDRERAYRTLLRDKKRTRDKAARDAIVRRLVEEERRRKKEAEMQRKLAEMGCCPVGFQWLRQEGGYRCAGGSHWMTDAQLGMGAGG